MLTVIDIRFDKLHYLGTTNFKQLFVIHHIGTTSLISEWVMPSGITSPIPIQKHMYLI